MWEICLGFMAAASCILNYRDLGTRSVDADGNKKPSAGDCIFLRMLVKKLGKPTSINLAGLAWTLAYIYHYAIAKLFPAAILLNMLNIMVAVLISARFCRLIYRLTRSTSSPASLFHSDLLTTTTCMWEIVLAGVVMLHLILE